MAVVLVEVTFELDKVMAVDMLVGLEEQVSEVAREMMLDVCKVGLISMSK